MSWEKDRDQELDCETILDKESGRGSRTGNKVGWQLTAGRHIG